MRKLTMAVVAATITAFAAPAFAGGGGCGGASHDQTAGTDYPTTTAEAPQTPRPDKGNGS